MSVNCDWSMLPLGQPLGEGRTAPPSVHGPVGAGAVAMATVFLPGTE